MVTLAALSFQMARVGMHVLRGPGSVAEGHSHFVPLVYPFVLGIVVLGVIRLLGRKLPSRLRAPRLSRLDFAGTTTLLAAAAGVLGLRVGTHDLRGLAPMVLIDTRRVVPATMPVGNNETLPRRVLVGASREDTLTLGGLAVRLMKDSTSVTIATVDGARRLAIPLPALELPQQVELVPVRADTVPVGFALLVTGSPRSNQVMFAVVDSTWRLIFLERMYRRWPATAQGLTLLRDSVINFDVMLLPRTDLTRRMYRLAVQ